MDIEKTFREILEVHSLPSQLTWQDWFNSYNLAWLEEQTVSLAYHKDGQPMEKLKKKKKKNVWKHLESQKHVLVESCWGCHGNRRELREVPATDQEIATEHGTCGFDISVGVWIV